jgi:DNA-binding transcriptional LysR family regulator
MREGTGELAHAANVRPAERNVKHHFSAGLHSFGVNAELRHLQYFIAVAEELHFTRAAERIHIAQQPLSAAIRRLERELGVELFRRTTRRVELTEAGAALLPKAREAVRAAEEAFAAARQAGRGETGTLTAGISPAARYGLEPLFATLRQRFPLVKLRIRQQTSQLAIEDLRAGQLDVGIGFCAEPPPDVSARRLLDAPAIVVVSEQHPLAGRTTVSMHELRDETFALADELEGSGYNDTVVASCRTAGFEPRLRRAVADHDAWETAVVHGGCVGITGRSAIYATRRDVRVLELTPPMSFPVDLLWLGPADTQRPVVTRFLELAGD